MENLNRLRTSGEDKVLVIAATATGKTYMSAFSNRYCSLHYQYLKGACHLSKVGNEFSIFVARFNEMGKDDGMKQGNKN